MFLCVFAHLRENATSGAQKSHLIVPNYSHAFYSLTVRPKYKKVMLFYVTSTLFKHRLILENMPFCCWLCLHIHVVIITILFFSCLCCDSYINAFLHISCRHFGHISLLQEKLLFKSILHLHRAGS